MLIKREKDGDEEEKKLNIIIKINMQQLNKRKPPFVQWKDYCSSIFILNLQTNMNKKNSLFSLKLIKRKENFYLKVGSLFFHGSYIFM